MIIEDIRDEQAAPAQAASDTTGRKLDPALLKQWRDFAGRLSQELKFDDPSQPPPRIGGFGWMKLPLPAGYSITLWRSTAQAQIGAFIGFAGAEKQRAYEELQTDRALIDSEFTDAGLDEPKWTADNKGSSIALKLAAPLPWDRASEDRQVDILQSIANQMVNSFRPRLERM